MQQRSGIDPPVVCERICIEKQKRAIQQRQRNFKPQQIRKFYKCTADENVEQRKMQTAECKPQSENDVALIFSLLTGKNDGEEKSDDDAGEVEHCVVKMMDLSYFIFRYFLMGFLLL